MVGVHASQPPLYAEHLPAVRARARARITGLTLLLAVALGTAGCVAGGDPPSNVAWYQAAGQGGAEALIKGTLVLDDGCTYVESDDAGRWLPIFADNVRADDGVVRYGHQTLRYGSAVELTGGESEILSGDNVPASCDDDVPVWRVAQ